MNTNDETDEALLARYHLAFDTGGKIWSAFRKGLSEKENEQLHQALHAETLMLDKRIYERYVGHIRIVAQGLPGDRDFKFQGQSAPKMLRKLVRALQHQQKKSRKQLQANHEYYAKKYPSKPRLVPDQKRAAGD